MGNTAARESHEPFEASGIHESKENNQENTAARESHEPSGAAGKDGAVEVRRNYQPPPLDVTVLAFGSGHTETLAGYCPVSNKIEPCTWKILPARDGDSDPSKIRIVF